MKRARIAIIVGLAAGLAAGLLSQASAQYPPPGGSVEAAAEQDTAVLGATVAISATVADVDGNPAAGVECTFAIAEQPGDDASVDPGPVVTDSAGVARSSLDVGTTTGTIVVEASCGTLSAQVSVVAGETVAPPAAPTDETGTTSGLPSTGTGDAAATSSGLGMWLIVSGTVGLSLMMTAFTWRRAHRR